MVRTYLRQELVNQNLLQMVGVEVVVALTLSPYQLVGVVEGEEVKANLNCLQMEEEVVVEVAIKSQSFLQILQMVVEEEAEVAIKNLYLNSHQMKEVEVVVVEEAITNWY